MAETIVDVGDEVPSSTIKVNLDVAYDRNRLKINKRGEYVAHLEGNLRPITTAIFRRSNPRGLLDLGGVALISYALHKLGYNAGPFYRGSIAFDITTEPDKESTVRRRLENGTFLQELREEVRDIIEDHSDILGDLKDFTIISCKEFQHTRLRNIVMSDSNFSHSVIGTASSILAPAPVTSDNEFQHMKLQSIDMSDLSLGHSAICTANFYIQPSGSLQTPHHSAPHTLDEGVCTFKEENVHVLECDDKFYTDHMEKSNGVYPVRHSSPKAHVLILNNYEGFKGGPQKDRHGAKRDGELMKQLWEGFQCKVIVKENQTAKKMQESLVKFSTNDFHGSCDFCVVIIMSHGNSTDGGHDYFCGIDDEHIKNDEVVKLFKNSEHRPHLIGKPKLIFFQSCRGVSAAPGVPLSQSSTDLPPQHMDQADNTEYKTVPENSDILVAYPTAKDMKAFRNKAAGSWFINAIAKVFSEQAKTEHVADMFIEVKNRISQQIAYAPEESYHRCQVSAETRDSLRKKLYLFPGFPKTNN